MTAILGRLETASLDVDRFYLEFYARVLCFVGLELGLFWDDMGLLVAIRQSAGNIMTLAGGRPHGFSV